MEWPELRSVGSIDRADFGLGKPLYVQVRQRSSASALSLVRRLVLPVEVEEIRLEGD